MTTNLIRKDSLVCRRRLFVIGVVLLGIGGCKPNSERLAGALPPDRVIGQVTSVNPEALFLVMEIEDIQIVSGRSVTLAVGDRLTIVYEEGQNHPSSFMVGNSEEEIKQYFEKFAIGETIHYVWTGASIQDKTVVLKHDRDIYYEGY
ncbi:hypothetical protein A5886_002685 [Enterococcus sp. 8G7_MSG3316]|uniref:Uncharacterized protein n=1 Tax=Candidatus Enterococcus testudinis TaxID=1834191 RepID=A0A242A973_9ENTE|nr:hypothetical protein [Enterococcus sp. 8G7_MSG3316]OTN77585.1 hypothetical protein A5886_002685 [Enterococcus sp. 8G7_MSG3316]